MPNVRNLCVCDALGFDVLWLPAKAMLGKNVQNMTHCTVYRACSNSLRTCAHCLLDGVCFVHLFCMVSVVRVLGVPAVLGVLGVFGEPGVATYVVSLSPLCSWMHLSESGSQPRRRWAQWLAQCTCDIIA